MRTLPSFSNQCNSFRLDIYALQLKGEHLVEGAMSYQRIALRLTFNRYFTRGSKLRVNIQSHMLLLDLDIYTVVNILNINYDESKYIDLRLVA